MTAERSRPTVVYDDTCGFCTGSARRLTRLDWLGRLDRLGYSAAVDRYPEVSRDVAGEGLRVRFPDGSVALGIDAVRAVLVRTPLGAPVGVLLHVPALRGIGDRVYRAVSARRRRPGELDACAVPAPRADRRLRRAVSRRPGDG